MGATITASGGSLSILRDGYSDELLIGSSQVYLDPIKGSPGHFNLKKVGVSEEDNDILEKPLLFSDFINGDTSEAFASADDLKAYVKSNFFPEAGEDTGVGSNEPSGNIKSFTVDYDAVGNGIADDTTAIANALAASQRIFDNGNFLVTSYDNSKGVNLDGAINILKATGNLNQKINTYAHKFQKVFGREHLAQFWAKLMAGTATKVILSGDSTTAGTGGTISPDVILSNLTNKFKVSGVTYINRGHGGQATSAWLSTYIAADLASTPDVYILRWGVNDSSLITPAQFLANLKTGLTTIRGTANCGADKLTIIIQSQSPTLDDNQGHKGQIYNEAVYDGLVGLSEYFQCVFIDTYGNYQDTVGAAGIFLDTDGIHPKQVLYNAIMTDVFQVLIPEFLRKNDVTDRSLSGIQGSALASAYNLGVNYDRVQVADGFPAAGLLMSNKMFDSINSVYITGQILFPTSQSGHYSRQALNDTFSAWVAHNINRGQIGSTADAPATYPLGMSSQFVVSDFPINGLLVTNRSDVAGGMSMQTLTSYDSGPTMYVRVSYLTGWQSWKQVTLI